jgi:cephalosporin-C deacetylase-like acetyl esterase
MPFLRHLLVQVAAFSTFAARASSADHPDAATLRKIAQAAADARIERGKPDAASLKHVRDLIAGLTNAQVRADTTSLLPLWERSAIQHARDRSLLAEIKRLGGKAIIEVQAPAWLREIAGDKALPAFGRIVEIDLNERSDGHAAPIPKKLADRVTDGWLAKIENQSALRRLELSGTAVTSAGLVHLKGLSKLEWLNVCLTAVDDRGFENLAALSRMKRMVVCSSKVTGTGFQHCRAMKQLESINLHSSPASDAGLEAIGKLTSLRRLEIVHTNVTDVGLQHLAGLVNLRQLHVHGPKTTENALPFLGKLVELYELDVYDRAASNQTLAQISKLSKLRKLMLVNGIFDDEGVRHLAKLTTLEELSLDSSKLTEACLAHLGGLRKLRKLSLGRTKLSPAGRHRLKALLPEIPTGGTAPARDELAVLDPNGDVPPRRMLRTYLLGEAQKHFDARRKVVAALKTPEDIQKRQRDLKAKFLEALGGFPEKTPLSARVVGTDRRDGYHVEKVIYESRPQHHVTATLYLSDGKPPFPGVLMPIGHSNNGKAAESIQRGAILLAKNGIAVLTYDPIGQGERRQLLDERGKPFFSGSTNEHTMIGVGALLVGRSTATYRIWDGIRSLDYLASRPEIDPKRLGCTGCSGGGTLTSYLMALDDRIVAAAPSCYITSLERLFATIGPQDAEQNITGQVAFGMEHADYLNLRAPRPTLICAASRDFFDIGGTWTTFREAKRIYGLMGHGERVDLFESDSGHGFPRSQREATLRWMRRWLQKIDDAPVEGSFPIVKDAELYCTRTGQVLEDLKGRSAFDLNAEADRELSSRRSRRTGEDLTKEIERLIGLKRPVAKATRKEVGVVKRDGLKIRKLIFENEPGILVPGLMFEKAEGKAGPLTVYLHGNGKSVDGGKGGRIEQLVGAGRRVLALDLRGLGETAPGTAPTGRPNLFGVDFTETYLSLHLNRPLLGQRVRDVLAVVEELPAEDLEGLDLVGIGTAGPVALHAAVLDPRIAGVTLERSLLSWSAVARASQSHDQLSSVVPGVLTSYDFPELAAALAPRPLAIRSAVDPVGKLVSKTVLDRTYALVVAAYREKGSEKKLVLVGD